MNHLGAQAAMQESGADEIDAGLPAQAAKSFAGSFDEKYGGFGAAPKFPTPHNLIFLMLYSEMRSGDTLDQVQKTLEQMRRGGTGNFIPLRTRTVKGRRGNSMSGTTRRSAGFLAERRERHFAATTE